MEKKVKHSGLFYQYLLSYVFILLIPLVILSMFVYGYVLDVLKEEIHANNMNTLQKAKDTIEVQLQNVTSLEHKVYLSNALNGFFLENDTVEAINAQKVLEEYCQMNPFLVDVAYYQEGDKYIIAASSSCKKEEFWNTMYLYENWDYEDFLKDLDENKDFFFKSAQQVQIRNINYQNIVTLVIPFAGIEQRCVLMLFDESYFLNVLPQPDINVEASGIVSADGQIIVSHGESSLMDAVYAEWSEGSQESDIVSINGREYLRSRVFSRDYHWNYETLVLVSGIEKKIVYVGWMMALVCFIVCVGGSLGIIYFMKRNYIPLHNLGIISDKILKNEGKKNEIDHVEAVLEYLNQQNQKLKANEEFGKLTLKEGFISKWMSGQLKEEQQIADAAAKVGITLNKECYQVIVARVDGCLSGQEQTIEQIFLSSFPLGLDVYVKMQLEDARFFVIIGYDENDKAAVDGYFSDGIHLLQNELDICLALGAPVHESTRLRESYMQALEALKYCFVMYEQKIIRYEEIVPRSNCTIDVHPRLLGKYIRNKNVNDLEAFLQAALHEIKISNADIRQIRMLCNDFIYALEKAIASVNQDYFIDNPLYYDISGILQYKDLRELLEIIRLISCDIIGHLNELSGHSIIEDLMSYIEKNCYSADFSTSSMAEAFEMSLPYLSRYFKKHIGKNLSDYVTELKIGKAKELLLYEDMPIKDVAEKVGYYSVNSFNRRFKQVTGCTPSEYRMTKTNIE